MTTPYTLSFTSASGKLKVLLLFNNKIQKRKILPIHVTSEDLHNPSPTLENILAPIRQRWDYLVATGQSPIKAMFPSRYSETKTPYEFFAEIHDSRLKEWKEYIGENLTWTEITDRYISYFVEYLYSQNIALSRIRGILVGLKRVFGDAKRRGYKISINI